MVTFVLRHARRFGLALLVASLLLPGAGRAADTAIPAPERAEIERIITDQIAAFGRDDGEAAFAAATPGLQAQFGDAAHFLDMVRAHYGAVYRARDFSFGDAVDENGQLAQRVRIVGPTGAAVTAIYFFERQPDGKLRISGCVLVAAQEQMI